MEQLKKCPVGIQTFENIIEGDYLYIDKTEYVYNLTHGAPKYFFLSRPRRFGKSLLTSTLKSYFEGKKELFKGLEMERLEKEWTQHPVLHFDMSTAKHVDKEQLESMLNFQLSRYEMEYGKAEEAVKINDRFTNLIMSAYKQTGQKVVVLIDEYDAPLLDVMHEERNLPVLRNVMRNFYSPLKACDPYLRFVFLTGITKFSQLSIFSELNNISNISMLKPYAAICGITKEELLTQMAGYIEQFADKLGVTKEEMQQKLKEKYDGYHFAWPSPDIYNPYSLLNAFNNMELGNYWFGSGTPTYLIEMLKKFNVPPSQIGGAMVTADDFDAPTEHMVSIIPLLYQSGYITIKDYDSETELYTLDIPNKEIRVGLMRSLLPNYMENGNGAPGNTAVAKISALIRRGDMDGALTMLQEFLLTIPYCDNTDYEGHYQQLLYVIFSLLGHYVDVEVRTPRGRVDIVLRTQTTLYIIELKLNKSAETAMRQIDLKDYPSRFALCGLPIVKVGINFDSEKKGAAEKIRGKYRGTIQKNGTNMMQKEKKFYLCPMKQKSSGINIDFIISFFLPEGMIDWFEVVNITEEPNTGKTRADILYSSILNIYLDERDNREGVQSGLRPNGFTEATVIKDYPIRNRKVLLHVRRRRYLDSDGKNVILNRYPLAADGTKVSVEFGLFFKDDNGQPAVNCDSFREILSY